MSFFKWGKTPPRYLFEDGPPIDLNALATVVQTALERAMRADYPDLQVRPNGEVAKLHANIIKLVSLYDQLRTENLKMLRRQVVDLTNLMPQPPTFVKRRGE